MSQPKCCPFCGDVRAPLIREEGPDGAGDMTFSAECYCCGAHGPWTSARQHALTLWNDRQPCDTSAEWRQLRQAETQ